MNIDFHYYATYCAAFLAGYDHENSMQIAYCAQFTDCCSVTLLRKIKGPESAATTQLQMELMDASTEPFGLQEITRIWASFHFLPGDLKARRDGCSKRYLHKYRLICNTNSELLKATVDLAAGRGTQAAGLAMHILADTWAHKYFAGTPSLAINNTNYYFYEIVPEDGGWTEKPVRFNHNPGTPDEPDKEIYTNSLYQGSEHSVMNLGHGRAGHFPDYSYARYRYLPAWGEYREIVKDNPSDFFHAFCQMVYALKCLKNGTPFETERYDVEAVWPYKDEIIRILEIRQTDACADWKALAEKISGHVPEDFDIKKYQQEYRDAHKDNKNETFLGRFISAALAQKRMVTASILASGNFLAGYSEGNVKNGFSLIKGLRAQP